MNRIYKKLGIWIAILALSPIAVFAATSYSVTNGAAPSVTEWGTCKVVTNNSGKQVYIPTNTSAEWASFYNHLPGGVSAAACCVPSGTNHNGCYAGSMYAVDSCNVPQYMLDGCSGSFCSSGNVVTYIGCTGDLTGGTCTTPNTTVCAAGCTNGACNACAAGYGGGCTSAANACGEVNSGSIQCDGSCSVGVPANSCTFSWGSTGSFCDGNYPQDQTGGSCGSPAWQYVEHCSTTNTSYACFRSNDGAQVDGGLCGSAPSSLGGPCDCWCENIYI